MIRYGFDYKVHCHCGALLDKIPLLHYFQGDGIMLDGGLPKANWPALLVRPENSTSAMHVDWAFFPVLASRAGPGGEDLSHHSFGGVAGTPGPGALQTGRHCGSRDRCL